MSAKKRLRLEQSVMPVSSEEELSLVTLREQNKRLSNNYNHRIRIENDLRKRIEQLENTLKECEDKEPENQLTVVNENLRNRVEDLEFELNRTRLNERRLADDLDRINNEFTELRKKTLQTNPDSIRHNSTTSASTITSANVQNDQQAKLFANSLSNSSGVPGSGSNADGGDPETNCAHHQATATESSHLALSQSKTIHELTVKLTDQTELAENRLKELEQLNEELREATSTIDRLKHEALCIPRETIVESAEYKTLQSHFSVLYNEATQLKTQLVESRQLMIEMQNAHTRQIERMESEEARIQRDYRTNIVDLEHCLTQARDQLTEIRRENDRLGKAHEDTLRLDTELKKSLANYKTQVQQKNNDLLRLKRKLDESKRSTENHPNDSDNKSAVYAANNNGENLNNIVSNHSNPNAINSNRPTHNNSSSSSITNSSVNNHSPSNKKHLDPERQIHQLQKQLDKTKSEEEALMKDLEITGQAYEELQEQNHRLLQQIEEKDEANFKLMSEHLKHNALQKHLNEEKMKLDELGKILQQKIEEQDRQIELLGKEMSLCKEYSGGIEKELAMRSKLNDIYKQEKLDLSQQLAEIKSEKDKITSQLEQIKKSFSERSNSLSHESFRSKRLAEDLDSLKKKYERASKLQSATTPDEVLMEEIREYKEQLTCPSCKTKPKDAVLTKCFHVFCFDCLRTRVETRQRKCPKCNAQFGANDFHRLYLA